MSASTAETLVNHAASSAITKAHEDQQFAELHTFRRLIEHVCDVHDIAFDSVRRDHGVNVFLSCLHVCRKHAFIHAPSTHRDRRG